MNSKKSHCSTFCCNFLTGGHVRLLFVTELTHTMCVAGSEEKQSRALLEEKKIKKAFHNTFRLPLVLLMLISSFHLHFSVLGAGNKTSLLREVTACLQN